MADTRKKGCPNTECVINQEEKKLKNDIDFCPKCGTKLVYVCSNKDCYNELTGLKFKETVCDECLAKSESKKAARKEKRKELADKSIEFVKEHGSEVVAVAKVAGPKAVDLAKKSGPVVIKVAKKAVKIIK